MSFIVNSESYNFGVRTDVTIDGSENASYAALHVLRLNGGRRISVSNMPNLRRLDISGGYDGDEDVYATTLFGLDNVPNLLYVNIGTCSVAPHALDGCRDTLMFVYMLNVPNAISMVGMPNMLYLELYSCGGPEVDIVVRDMPKLLVARVANRLARCVSFLNLKSLLSIDYEQDEEDQLLVVDRCPGLVRAPGIKRTEPDVVFTDAERAYIKAYDHLRLTECTDIDDFVLVVKYMFSEYEYGNSKFFCTDVARLMQIVLPDLSTYQTSYSRSRKLYLMHLPDLKKGPVADKLPTASDGGKILPFFIVDETKHVSELIGLDGNKRGRTSVPMVTDVWVSSTLVGCGIAKRAVFTLKPWVVNGILDSGIGFWRSMGVMSENEWDPAIPEMDGPTPKPPKYLQAIYDAAHGPPSKRTRSSKRG